MKAKPRTPEETYGPALRKAQREFPGLDPHETAVRAAVRYETRGSEHGSFQILFMGTTYSVQWPEGIVQRAADLGTADVATQILLLHYLLTSDGTPLASKWIAFRNLPGGLGYDAAFQKRASARLTQAFGSELTSFKAGARALGGEPLTFGDASFLFRVLPRVWLAVVLYTADQEFPAEGNVLFDAAASHYLPTEDLAVIGGLLAGRIIKAGGTG